MIMFLPRFPEDNVVPQEHPATVERDLLTCLSQENIKLPRKLTLTVVRENADLFLRENSPYKRDFPSGTPETFKTYMGFST